MPLPRFETRIRPEWIDSNGHMNLAYYVLVFDLATDAAYDALDIGAAYRARSGNSSFAVETHTLYEQEVGEGEAVFVTTRLLGVDAKRLHYVHEMFRAADRVRLALHELLCIHIDMAARRAAPWPAATRAALEAAVAAEAMLPVPRGVGRRVGQKRG
ncbi:MAG: thioesterase family protein [Rhodospirillales bacterium]|nr:thioesterase family protein [Rhodospirillales bacterium]